MFLADDVTSWFDSPGDILAILSVLALLIGGVLYLIDSRLSAIRVAVDDLKESNEDTHSAIIRRLEDHMASPAHDRRQYQNPNTPYKRRATDQ